MLISHTLTLTAFCRLIYLAIQNLNRWKILSVFRGLPVLPLWVSFKLLTAGGLYKWILFINDFSRHFSFFRSLSFYLVSFEFDSNQRLEPIAMVVLVCLLYMRARAKATAQTMKPMLAPMSMWSYYCCYGFSIWIVCIFCIPLVAMQLSPLILIWCFFLRCTFPTQSIECILNYHI